MRRPRERQEQRQGQPGANYRFGAGRNVTAEPERRWVPLVGSGVVGCVTNWIALLWIFNPVDPRRVGPVTLQGCFLRRQL